MQPDIRSGPLVREFRQAIAVADNSLPGYEGFESTILTGPLIQGEPKPADETDQL